MCVRMCVRACVYINVIYMSKVSNFNLKNCSKLFFFP